MRISKLEMTAAGLLLLGVANAGAGHFSASTYRNQIKTTPQVAKVKELENEIGKIMWRTHDMFYRRDPKSHDRPVADFLNPKNRQAISEAWSDYDRLNVQYEAALSQPGVKELIEKNKSLNQSASDSSGNYDLAALLLIGGGIITFMRGSSLRSKKTFDGGAQPTSTQGYH